MKNYSTWTIIGRKNDIGSTNKSFYLGLGSISNVYHTGRSIQINMYYTNKE